MRQFKLWNSAQSVAFDFTAEGAPITEVKGLGVGFYVTKNNRAVVGYGHEFEDIQLTANFGVRTNAYSAYNGFMAFVAANGRDKFVLEYQANGRTVYADVWLKKAPKSQRDEYRLITETIVFDRVTYWYTKVTGSLVTSPDAIGIVNDIFDDIPVNLYISGPTTGNLEVSLKQGSTIIAKTQLLENLTINQGLNIYSDTKTVQFTNGAVGSNGYNKVSKAFDTFIQVPKGSFTLSITGGTGSVVYSFRKWVLD